MNIILDREVINDTEFFLFLTCKSAHIFFVFKLTRKNARDYWFNNNKRRQLNKQISPQNSECYLTKV